jgi:hypothetical protein
MIEIHLGSGKEVSDIPRKDLAIQYEAALTQARDFTSELSPGQSRYIHRKSEGVELMAQCFSWQDPTKPSPAPVDSDPPKDAPSGETLIPSANGPLISAVPAQ